MCVNIPTGQVQELAEIILGLKQTSELLDALEENGRAQLESKFARFFCVDQYEKKFIQLAKASRETKY
jgi:hypothetical protein